MRIAKQVCRDALLKPDLPQDLVKKVEALVEWFDQYRRVVVSYSGGVDSALVAFIARTALGRDGVMAVVADSPSLPRRELREALEFARRHDIPCTTIDTDETNDPSYAANEGDRCYFCKLELYSVLWDTFDSGGYDAILCGTNSDDVGDYRPGMKAADELKVRSPLLETGFSKEEVRTLSRVLGLETWDKPALACLASRVPYGEMVTEERLSRIEAAEEVLWNEGFQIFRVRFHGDLGRLEIAEDEIHRFEDKELRDRIFEGIRGAGFQEVILDPEPYRSGRFNDLLKIEERGE